MIRIVLVILLFPSEFSFLRFARLGDNSLASYLEQRAHPDMIVLEEFRRRLSE
uniref:DUF1273 family protein n=1 Tax=Heterorhabditis bacteriophora TaxID=37862 RepID=A0A1I7W704_HETBA